MTGRISLRAATEPDYDFALQLYLDGIRTYAVPLMSWDDQEQAARFAQQWHIEEAEIILHDGRPVGFLMSRVGEAEIALNQFYVAPDCQRQGIGSMVLDELMRRWRAAGKPVALGVLRTNPARLLYERFGFRVVEETPLKLLMRRELAG